MPWNDSYNISTPDGVPPGMTIGTIIHINDNDYIETKVYQK